MCQLSDYACLLWLNLVLAPLNTNKKEKKHFWQQFNFWHNMTVFCYICKGRLKCNSPSLAWRVHKHKDGVSHQWPPVANGQRHVSAVWSLGAHFKDLGPLGGLRRACWAQARRGEGPKLAWLICSDCPPQGRKTVPSLLIPVFLRLVLQRWGGGVRCRAVAGGRGGREGGRTRRGGDWHARNACTCMDAMCIKSHKAAPPTLIPPPTPTATHTFSLSLILYPLLMFFFHAYPPILFSQPHPHPILFCANRNVIHLSPLLCVWWIGKERSPWCFYLTSLQPLTEFKACEIEGDNR